LLLTELAPTITAKEKESWSIETLDQIGGMGQSPSIALDSKNRPHICFFDPTYHELKYGYLDGDIWYIDTVDNDSRGSASIVLDTMDRPHICYWGNMVLKLAHYDIDHWEIETVDSNCQGGITTSVAISSGNWIHI